MKVLTAAAMREVDRRAIEEIGIPSMVLMENAAIGVVEAVGEEFAAARSVLVLCGPGNNGGDGLAVARHLDARGYRVAAWLAVPGASLGGDAAAQLEICRRQGVELRELDGDLPDGALDGWDLVVDALFGTGLTRPLEGRMAELVEAVNAACAPVLAVDLPSGLDASLETPPGPAIEADLTVAFAAPKIAHVLPPACERVGRLAVADLGIPAGLVEWADGDVELLEAERLAPALSRRPAAAHKGHFGHLLVVAGSEGKSGAAILAARAAVAAGAGLVTVAAPRPIVAVVEAGSHESMTLPLAVEGDGGLAAGGLESALAAAAERDALAVGPGLGTAPATREWVRRLVLDSTSPLVLDADGLNAFAGRAAELRERAGPAVLTPHPGELARLLAVEPAEVLAERLTAARRAAELSGAIVVLKGFRTLVADPEGGVAVNPTGNPGMATGGTGDVLTGMIGALLAGGLDAMLAAELGVYLHGLAGDRAAGERGEISLRASDLIDHLPGALRRLGA